MSLRNIDRSMLEELYKKTLLYLTAMVIENGGEYCISDAALTAADTKSIPLHLDRDLCTHSFRLSVVDREGVLLKLEDEYERLLLNS